MKNEVDWGQHTANRLQLMKQHPLRYLFMEVTRRCNLRCAYCGSDCTADVARQEMPTDEWRRVIREIASDFDASKIMVAVTGGEPLLRPDIFEIFGELEGAGYKFGMVSNGQKIEPDMARRLTACGIGSISLSYDAPAAVNDALRGKGVSEGVERAIRNLKEAGYKGILEIISTITKPCMPLLDDMRKHIAKLKVPCWRMAPVMPIGRAARRPDLLLDPREVRALLEYIEAGRADGLKPVPEFSEEGFLGDELEGAVRPYLCRCNAGITIGGILHDGRIGACPELGDAFTQGHVSGDRVKDVWEERYQIFRDRSWTKKGLCADCDAFHPCLGGALHLYETPGHDISRCFYKMLCETA